ncbi:MAG: hypothetical protein K5945_10800 [Bacteroidaceae bacterium]|nr:hypothetical protein [Bacteroidaceae bacterium]
MNAKHFFALVLTLLWLLPQAVGAQKPLSTREFSLPDMKWRPIPLWFWNNATVEGDQLEVQLEQMVKTDYYGGCAILPFGTGFRPGYLSPEYFTLYGRAIEKAKSMGAHMSIYDEYGFPSGSMGAINGSGVTTFKNNHPEHTIKRLDKTEITVAGGTAVSRRFNVRGRLMSIVAWNRETNEIVSLREHLNADNLLTWTVPEGIWQVMLFQCVTDGDPNVDYLSPEAVGLFIQDTHGAYHAHFPEAFGTTVVSTFFDEPTMYRAQGRMWTNDFNEKFQARYGFSPEMLYPALWYNIGPTTAAARNMLFAMRSDLYARGFMGSISTWADAHHILATGHQDQEEIVNPSNVAGDLMLDGKYLSMPGIDKIGGPVGTENFYKVVSSSANNWDKAYVMSETYGAMGNISVETMYQVAIEQYTKGINHLIPHAVWYDDHNVTFLPELSWRNSLYNKALPRFNRFLSRLNYMLARPGRHVADVAMLYPIQTQYAGNYLDGPKGYYTGGVDVPGTDYTEVSRLLTDELGIDFTYLHPEVLDDRCRVEEGWLEMCNETNSERFSVVVLPGVKTISTSNMKKIEEAWAAGATVIFTTQQPSESADMGGDEEVQAIVARMTAGAEGAGKAIFVAKPTAETLHDALMQHPRPLDVESQGGSHPFNYIHRMLDGRDVYFFGNLDATTSENTILLRNAPASALLLDPRSGECSTAELTATDDGRRQLKLRLRPNQSVFLVDEALIEQNGGDAETEEKGLSYTIEARVLIEKLSAGICFASSDSQNFYMWQFNVSKPAAPCLRPHSWMGGAASVLGEVPLKDEARIQRNKAFNIRLEVENEQYVTTYVNDVLVDERAGNFVYGKFGFRQAHDDTYGSEETARFDDVRVTRSDGRVLFFSDFSSANPFTAGTVMAGWLRVQGGMSNEVRAWVKVLPDGIASVMLPLRSSPAPQMWSLSGMPLSTTPRHMVYIKGNRKVLSR